MCQQRYPVRASVRACSFGTLRAVYIVHLGYPSGRLIYPFMDCFHGGADAFLFAHVKHFKTFRCIRYIDRCARTCVILGCAANSTLCVFLYYLSFITLYMYCTVNHENICALRNNMCIGEIHTMTALKFLILICYNSLWNKLLLLSD